MPYHPLIHGLLAFLIAIPALYFLTGEINWKFAFWFAAGTSLAYYIGSII